MATYVDNASPLDTSAEFRKVVAASPYLVRVRARAAAATSRTIRRAASRGRRTSSTGRRTSSGPSRPSPIYHLTIWRDPADPTRAAVASKQIYASHYFQAGLDLTALVDAPAPPGGFYLVDLYRARIDPPTGMLSGVLLGKIRGGIEQGVAEGLRTAKQRTESRNRSRQRKSIGVISERGCGQVGLPSAIGFYSVADDPNRSTTHAVQEKSRAPFPSPVVGW